MASEVLDGTIWSCSCRSSLLNHQFHYKATYLAGLNTRKAYGPDGVPLIVLRNCASVLVPCLVILFQLCLSTSTFPSCWIFAYIQPFPKKGDRSNPSNYRPIALISCLSKNLFLIYSQQEDS